MPKGISPFSRLNNAIGSMEVAAQLKIHGRGNSTAAKDAQKRAEKRLTAAINIFPLGSKK